MERATRASGDFQPWRYRGGGRLEARRRELFSILPFVPEQSVTHHAAHVVYAVGQIPLVVLSHRALRASAAVAGSGR
jgi:hypothetical protein